MPGVEIIQPRYRSFKSSHLLINMNSRRLDVFLDQTPPVVTTRYQALKQRNKNKLTLKNCHSICLSKFFKDAPISDHFQG